MQRRWCGCLSAGHRHRCCTAGRSPGPAAAGGEAAGGRRPPELEGGGRGASPSPLRRRARPCPRHPAAAVLRQGAGARWQAAPGASSPLASLQRWEEVESEGCHRRARPAARPPGPHPVPRGTPEGTEAVRCSPASLTPPGRSSPAQRTPDGLPPAVPSAPPRAGPAPRSAHVWTRIRGRALTPQRIFALHGFARLPSPSALHSPPPAERGTPPRSTLSPAIRQDRAARRLSGKAYGRAISRSSVRGELQRELLQIEM